MIASFEAAKTALVIIDLQNDFLHPDGAYARGGLKNADIAALPGRIKPLVDALRSRGGCVISTHFTLVPGRGGEPIISQHLLQIRPFLCRGDFMPGSWGHAQVDELGPADMSVEKVAYSAFYMTRLEWLLRKTGIEHIIISGIVTNGGVASTVRDAHVRDIGVTVLEDGCAAFSRETHNIAIEALRPIANISTINQALDCD